MSIFKSKQEFMEAMDCYYPSSYLRDSRRTKLSIKRKLKEHWNSFWRNKYNQYISYILGNGKENTDIHTFIDKQWNS